MEHLYIDKYSDLNSFIHRLDPRIKLISFSVFIVFITSTTPYSNLKFLLYFLIILALILASKIPVNHFLKNLLAIFPFVALTAISMPFFNTAGGNRYNIGVLNLSVTSSGILVLKNVLLKAFLSILVLTILSSTTKFQHLLKGLGKLKFPKIFIMILAFMHRYIFVLIDEKMRMERAAVLKHFNKKIFLQFRTLGNITGSLFINAYERSERIYGAMCSRLFDGSIRTINILKIGLPDILFLIVFFSILFTVRFL